MRIKELVLREFGDQGADTFEKHWAQIVYTAHWCIHMVMPASGILGIIPEGIDDVTVTRRESRELHQVKCRDETQLPWTTAEVLPILSQQYHRRHAFRESCQFHFVSDYVADTKTQFKPDKTYGSLSRLKQLLDIEHSGQTFTKQESDEFIALEKALVERIKELLSVSDSENIDDATAKRLLHNTWIETNSKDIRGGSSFLDELSEAISQAFPGQLFLTVPQLQEIYDRILLLIVKKINSGNTLVDRTISRDEILNCRSLALTPEVGLPNLDNMPGTTRAEKKAYYGGFDITEFPVFALQRIRANEKQRALECLGFGDQITDTSLALITIQQGVRRDLSRKHVTKNIGPMILERLKEDIPNCIQDYFPDHEIDEVFCYGLIWQATNECYLWWHRIIESEG